MTRSQQPELAPQRRVADQQAAHRGREPGESAGRRPQTRPVTARSPRARPRRTAPVGVPRPTARDRPGRPNRERAEARPRAARRSAGRRRLRLCRRLVRRHRASRPVPPGMAWGRMNNASANAVPGDVVTGALRDVERFWAAAYPRGRRRRAVPAGPGRLPPVHRGRPAAGLRRPSRRVPAERLLLPGRRLHRLGRPDADPAAAERLRPAAGRRRHGPRVRARDPGPARRHRAADRRAGAAGRLLRRRLDSPTCWPAAPTAFTDVTPAQLDNTVAGHAAAARPAGHVGAGRAGARQRLRPDPGAAGRRARRAPPRAPATAPTTCRSPRCRSPAEDEAATGGDLPYAEAVELAGRGRAGLLGARVPAARPASRGSTLQVQPFDAGLAAGLPGPGLLGRRRAPSTARTATSSPSTTRSSARRCTSSIGDNAVGMLLGDLFARAVAGPARRARPRTGRASSRWTAWPGRGRTTCCTAAAQRRPSGCRPATWTRRWPRCSPSAGPVRAGPARPRSTGSPRTATAS